MNRISKTLYLIIFLFSFEDSYLLADEETLYETSFEVKQGFNPNYELRDQGKWKIEGTAGNGLIKNRFGDDFGNQAYLGAFKPNDINEEYLICWPQISGITNFDKKFTFSVSFMIADSEAGNRDYFQWSIFNSEQKPLFTLDFDNKSKIIGYILGQNGDLINSDYTFENDFIYDLKINFDLNLRLFSVEIGDETILSNIAINLNETTFNFSEVNAVWFFSERGNPGDNFMAFDDYKIVVDRADSEVTFFDEISIKKSIESNSLSAVKTFLEEGLSPDFRIDDSTLLTSSVFHNSTEIVSYLLKKGANPNLWDNKGKSPLALACEKGNERISKILLEYGANIYYKYPDGENLLTKSTLNESFEIVSLLLNNNLDVDFQNSNSLTPLHLSSYIGNEIISMLLLSFGADINSINSKGQKPLDLCIETTNYDLANKFKDYVRMEYEFIKRDSLGVHISFKIHTALPGEYSLGFKVPIKNVGILFSENLSTWSDYTKFELNDMGINEFNIKNIRKTGDIKFFKPALR